MKVRIRFTKTGPIRFVGHLDFMRYFQKALKRSGISCAYTKGFSPHMLLSFAAPLGVGEETTGDYVDVELAYRDMGELDDNELYRLKDIGLENDKMPEAPESSELIKMLNAANVDGVTVTGMRRVGQKKADNAMALVHYADYELLMTEWKIENLSEKLAEFWDQEEIIVHKKTKKSEIDTDIKKMVKSLRAEGDTIYLTCATGSSSNLKPALLMEAFARKAGEDYDPYGYRVTRTELYTEDMIPMGQTGIEF